MYARLILALCSFFLLMHSGQGLAATIDELVAKQTELARVRLQAEIEAVQNRAKQSQPAAAPMIAVPPNVNFQQGPQQPGGRGAKTEPKEDLRLVAVYGIDEKLMADIAVNDVVTPAQKGEYILGWQITKIRSNKVQLAKSGETRELNLSIVPTATPSVSQNGTAYFSPNGGETLYVSPTM